MGSESRLAWSEIVDRMTLAGACSVFCDFSDKKKV